jgi:hypothetical protein
LHERAHDEEPAQKRDCQHRQHANNGQCVAKDFHFFPLRPPAMLELMAAFKAFSAVRNLPARPAQVTADQNSPTGVADP